MTVSPLAYRVLHKELYKDWEKRREPAKKPNENWEWEEPRECDLTPFERANTLGNVCKLPDVEEKK